MLLVRLFQKKLAQFTLKIYTINSPFIKINLKNLKKIKKRSEENYIICWNFK